MKRCNALIAIRIIRIVSVSLDLQPASLYTNAMIVKSRLIILNVIEEIANLRFDKIPLNNVIHSF